MALPLFSLFILFLKASCVISWLADKCLFYGDVEEFPVATTCAGKTNIAECHHVTDIKEDLRGLPSNLLNLCIHMEQDCCGTLAPDSFSRFVSLENLEIAGCFSEIPLEAFNGLTNDISEVLCRLAKTKSLTLFKLEEYELNRLQYPNCSVFNTSDDYVSTVFNIEETDFLRDLSLIGVHTIHSLTVRVDVLNVDDLCTAAKLYSVESLEVRYETINLPPTPTNISHGCEDIKGIALKDLQENPIIHIEPKSFGHLINLCSLLLGDLNFPPDVPLIRLHFSDMFGIIPYNLSNVFISSGLRPMQLVIGNNATLEQGLNFHIKGKYVTVEDCNSSLLTSVVTLKINAAYTKCGNEFIGKYVRSVVNLEFESMFSDNIGDLVVINQLVHLQTLKLENIDLTKQPNLAIMFRNLTKLQTLMLTNCRMFFLDGSLTKDLKALTGLVLMPKDNINIFQNLVEHLTSLKYLQFQGLGLYCNCDNAWLVSWVKDNRKVQVAMFSPFMKELQCLTDNGIDHLNFVDYSKNCSFDVEFVFFASTSAFLCIFIIVVLSYKFTGQYIAPVYHIASGWFREALRVTSKHQYRYDVFVSYSSKDEHWVIEELLPNLERRGPPFLRLCLHSRDFQLGQDIVENITDSIYASRRTLCLISRNYLGSNWCSLEMQLATYRLQVEHRDILIMLFLEVIPSRLLSSHHRLARLVKTRTYLDWPQDPEMHEAFWDRLWCKLSSNTTN
ncbi:Toll-like receptor 13 [Labeo rohita]|uniref:Toll-like receptor 13 n=1 Tax=Labeo rohita TaxID=84645 RepID=A0ABQ8MCQ5_LABRO|nr:Toll-like receptor 13 [Labeo rohita]